VNLPLITSYSNLQLRLGYMKLLVALASRQPTDRASFEARLKPLFPLPKKETRKLNALNVPDQASKAYTAVESSFEALGHQRGLLTQQNLSELWTLAKSLRLLHEENLSLLESGAVLQQLLPEQTIEALRERRSRDVRTLLVLDADKTKHRERLFFFIQLFTTDLVVFLLAIVAAKSYQPFRIYDGFVPLTSQGGVATQQREKLRARGKKATMDTASHSVRDDDMSYNANSLLLQSYNLVRVSASNNVAIRNWRQWVDYFEGERTASAFSQQRLLRMGKRSSYRHHIAPRLEFLVDLGFLNNSKHDDKDSVADYKYVVTESGRRLGEFLEENFLHSREMNPVAFVRRSAIQCYAHALSLHLREPTESEMLELLLEGFSLVRREIIATPMLSVAIAASMLALERGIRVEIASMYDFVQEKSRSGLRGLRLSGGSRFDGEFLIAINPQLLRGDFSNEDRLSR
jgi:hypothetical protein